MSHADAKHLLACSHHIGGNARYYTMRCDVLKTMPDGRLKVRVYGRMYWKGTEVIERIRYVGAWRVTPCPISQFYGDRAASGNAALAK